MAWDLRRIRGAENDGQGTGTPGRRGSPAHVSPSGRPNGSFPSQERRGGDRPEVRRHRTARPGRGTSGAFPLGAVHTGSRGRGGGARGGSCRAANNGLGFIPGGVHRPQGIPAPTLVAFLSGSAVGSENEATAGEVGGRMRAASRRGLPLRGGRSRNRRGPIVRLRVGGMMGHG